MDLNETKAFVDLVRGEAKRRSNQLHPYDDDAANYQWRFIDTPFLNDLCVIYLVGLRHHIERSLRRLAARALGHGRPIGRADYRQELQKVRSNGWGEIERRLSPKDCAYYKSIEALQHLANSYKHDPNLKPNDDLLDHLNLDKRINYAPIAESGALLNGLTHFLSLPPGSTFTDIVQKFSDQVDEFLRDVEGRNRISNFRPEPVSMNPSTFEH